MAQVSAWTRIVLERPDGRVEIVTRPGHLGPFAVAQQFAAAGKVTAVRHLAVGSGSSEPATVAIHKMG
jgi:hypothetical protein